MLTDRGKIKFDDRTNVVIVTDIPTNLYRISQIVGKLDKRTPQVLIEAKIIEVTLADDERLGVDWDTVITATGAQRPLNCRSLITGIDRITEFIPFRSIRRTMIFPGKQPGQELVNSYIIRKIIQSIAVCLLGKSAYKLGRVEKS